VINLKIKKNSKKNRLIGMRIANIKIRAIPASNCDQKVSLNSISSPPFEVGIE
jgi:hypothetical protein